MNIEKITRQTFCRCFYDGTSQCENLLDDFFLRARGHVMHPCFI